MSTVRTRKSYATPLPIHTQQAVVLADVSRARTCAADVLIENRAAASAAVTPSAKALASALTTASPQLLGLARLRDEQAIDALRILMGFSRANLALLLDGDAKNPSAVAALCASHARRSAQLSSLRALAKEVSTPTLTRMIAAIISRHLEATEFRMKQSRSQEGELSVLLAGAGYTQVLGMNRVENTDDLEPGEFIVGDVMVGNRDGAQKADAVVRTRSGALLIIEARVSNSKVNAHKSFAQAIPAKAGVWARAMNDARVQVVAIVAGDTNENIVIRLQNAGVRVVWNHDLAPLKAALR